MTETQIQKWVVTEHDSVCRRHLFLLTLVKLEFCWDAHQAISQYIGLESATVRMLDVVER